MARRARIETQARPRAPIEAATSSTRAGGSRRERRSSRAGPHAGWRVRRSMSGRDAITYAGADATRVCTAPFASEELRQSSIDRVPVWLAVRARAGRSSAPPRSSLQQLGSSEALPSAACLLFALIHTLAAAARILKVMRASRRARAGACVRMSTTSRVDVEVSAQGSQPRPFSTTSRVYT